VGCETPLLHEVLLLLIDNPGQVPMGFLSAGHFTLISALSIRRVLNELPITLDDTYERALQGIPKGKREHAHRLLQVTAIRPLRVELAELFMIDFDPDARPNLNEGQRPEYPEDAVLSTCSTLITTRGTGV
jgi:hypothetical protein